MKRITLYNATRDQVRKALNGERVTAEHAHDPIRCQYCGTEFTPKKASQRFCTTRCRVYHHRNVNEEKG